MALNDKVIIEVALNENQMRAANPNVPYSPVEIAQSARECYSAGAAVVHYHGRNPTTGAPLMSDAGVSLATQRLITETTPLIAYPTYGSMTRVLDYYDIGDPAPQRFGHIVQGIAEGIPFEVGPVDLGAYDANAFPTPNGMVPSTGLLMNTGVDHQWKAKFCNDNGMKITFALFDTRHVRNLKNVIDWGIAGRAPLIVKYFLNGFNASMSSEARFLTHYLDETHELVAAPTSWMAVTGGSDQFPMCASAMSRGGHARVGVGDYHYADHGAPTNAALVERLVRMARALGREPATPDEARAIWGIPIQPFE